MQSVKIQHIHVRKGAIDLDISISVKMLHVKQEQADWLLGKLPNLARHVCVSSNQDGIFGAELVGTEQAHLLEHLIIELQGRAMPDKSYTFTGHTSWLEEIAETGPHGYAFMRVTVTYVDDLVALRAINDAINLIDESLGTAID